MKTEIMRKVLAGLAVTTIFGILVACGKNAVELDEKVARDFVNKTLGG